MEKLTHQEEELLLIIFQTNGGFIKDFINQMQKTDIPYTTVASIVKNIEKKGYIKGKLFGNSILYQPTLDETEFKSRYMSNVVEKYFENSYKDMVTFFIEKEKLSSEELKEIINLIEKKK